MTAAFSPCTLITARISSPRMEMYRNFSSEVRRIAAAAGSAFLTDSLSFLLTLSALSPNVRLPEVQTKSALT